MSYHPDPYVRSYTDRGTMKWLGFYLSEHTAEMQIDQEKRTKLVPRYTAMTFQACMTILTESYQQNKPVEIQLDFLLPEGQAKHLIKGSVMGIEENSLFLRAISQKIEVIELSTIKYVAFLTDSKWSDLT